MYHIILVLFGRGEYLSRKTGWFSRQESKKETGWFSRKASLVAQMVKNLPAIEETQVQSLGWEDHLEKQMATHSSILAWRSPWTEESGGLQSMGSQRSQTQLSDSNTRM